MMIKSDCRGGYPHYTSYFGEVQQISDCTVSINKTNESAAFSLKHHLDVWPQLMNKLINCIYNAHLTVQPSVFYVYATEFFLELLSTKQLLSG